MKKAFSLVIDDENIAWITFDLPGEKVNKLSTDTLEQLMEVIEEVKKSDAIVAVIRSGKPGNFIAGLDLKQMESFIHDQEVAQKLLRSGHASFNKLERLSIPTVAIIDGACLGGGLELALSCTYRAASDSSKTQLGLPETTLGIVPGWGGTARLPELVGLSQGLKMIVSGKSVDADKAYKIRLVDTVLSNKNLEEETQKFVHTLLDGKTRKKLLKRRQRLGFINWLKEGNPLGRALIRKISERQVLKKTKGRYPAPLAAIDIVCKDFALPPHETIKKDLEFINAHIPGAFDLAEELVGLFFLNEELKKETGVEGEIKPTPIKSAAVIGAGTMGAGIAWLFSYRDTLTRMRDIDLKQLCKGYKQINGIYKLLAKIKQMSRNDVLLKLSNLTSTTNYDGFYNRDLVVEAATENFDLKIKIFSELEQKISKNTIIATNTSSLSVNQLASHLKRPERFIGMHFFNPVNRMPLVEIIPHDNTSKEVIASVVAFCKQIKKTPIVVKDCQGFLVNRIFVTGLIEMLRMLEEGTDMQRIDKLMVDFGMPMEPFYLADVVGNDVNASVLTSFQEAYKKRMHTHGLIKLMKENDLLGKKTGKGFYLHDKKKKTPNPEVAALVKKMNAPKQSLSDEEIVNRALFAMIDEAARCLEENVVKKPGYLDMAMVMGTGFPPFRGGLLKYGDKIGIDNIVKSLEDFHRKYKSRAPSEALKKKKSFYS